MAHVLYDKQIQIEHECTEASSSLIIDVTHKPNINAICDMYNIILRLYMGIF